LSKLNKDYDPTDRTSAMSTLQKHKSEGKLLTGLIYIDADAENLHDTLSLPETPLNELKEDTLCPGADALSSINAGLK